MVRYNSNLPLTDEFAQKIKAEQRSAIITRWAPVFILIALVIVFSITCSTSFPTLDNVITILNQLAIPLVVATGLTFVIIIGSIDLSIDGAVGMTGSIFSLLVLNNQNSNNLGIAGVILMILLGLLTGAIVGTVFVKARIPSFMVSFGMSSIATGIAVLSYQGVPATIEDPLFVELSRASILGIPFITLVAVVIFVIAYIIQKYTSFGRYIYAVGINESVTRLSGVNINRIKILAFAFCGICIGIAGVLGCIRLGRGDVLIGKSTMFPAVTAIVIGGTPMTGGKGGVINTLIGATIMTVLNNGLILIGISPYIQTGIQGLIILVAVALTVTHKANGISK